VRTGLIKERERLENYRWSSYPSYLREKKKRATRLRVDRLLGELGLSRDNHHTGLEFARRMQTQRRERNDTNLRKIRRGWHHGAEDFLVRLVDQLSDASG